MQKQKKFLFFILLLFILLIFVIGCEETQVPIQQTNPKPSPGTGQVPDNRTQTIIQDKILMTATTDKEIYSPGELVNVIVEIENQGKKPILYQRKNPCEPDLLVYIDLPDSERIYLNEKEYESKHCIQIIDDRILPAKQKIKREVVWDQKLNTKPEKIQALPGKYTITTQFNYNYEEETKELILVNEIQIKGDTNIKISRDDAIKIAYSNEDVINWYNAHLGKNLIEEEYGKYYLVDKYGRDRIDNASAHEILESKPVIDLSYQNNIWEITFWSKYGEEPKQITILIDAETGEIKEIKK